MFVAFLCFKFALHLFSSMLEIRVCNCMCSCTESLQCIDFIFSDRLFDWFFNHSLELEIKKDSYLNFYFVSAKLPFSFKFSVVNSLFAFITFSPWSGAVKIVCIYTFVYICISLGACRVISFILVTDQYLVWNLKIKLGLNNGQF